MDILVKILAVLLCIIQTIILMYDIVAEFTRFNILSLDHIQYFIRTKILHRKEITIMLLTADDVKGPHLDKDQISFINKTIILNGKPKDKIMINKNHSYEYEIHMIFYTIKTINKLLKNIKNNDPFIGVLSTKFNNFYIKHNKKRSLYIFTKNVMDKGIII